MNEQLVVKFGALSGTLKNQLEVQGFTMPQPPMRSLQKRIHEIINLRILSFASGAEARKIEARIAKVIRSQARPCFARAKEVAK